MNGSRITRHSSLVRAGWKQALVALAVLASCAGGLVMDAHAILKTCKLTVASPAAMLRAVVGLSTPQRLLRAAPPVRKRRYAFAFGANSDGGTQGDYIYTTSKATLSGSAISNFDTDGLSDIAVYRPSNGVWYGLNSTNGGLFAAAFGTTGDRIVPGDYDGDGRTDVAVWRGNTSTWYIIRSSDDAVQQVFWGASYAPYFDVPAPGDYDGDGRADIAVWRGNTTDWWIIRSSDDTVLNVQWGANLVEYLDIPAPGDYDGDGRDDVAVFRPSNGTWYVIRSSGGFLGATWGLAGDAPAPQFDTP